MAYTQQLQSLLTAYRADIDALEKTRRPTDGFLGFGKKPGDDACHEKLDQQAAALAADLAADPGSMETADMLRLLFAAGADESWPNYAHWWLLALQRHFLPLIPRLSQEERKALAADYDRLCPRRQRLPLQKQMAKALKG